MEYDAIVIGAGTAGETVLAELNKAGMTVAVVEEELVGGLCAYWGCMPSKTLLRPGDVQWEAEHAVGTSRPALAWPDVSKYRDYMVRSWDDSRQVEELKKQNIDVFRGHARIAAQGLVQVNGQTLRAQRIVIATGTEASVPPIPGLKEVGYWTNREGTAFKEVPRSAIVLGGGAVGCELGQVLRRFGAEVTLVDLADHLLPHESPEASGYLEEAFEGEGITLHLGRKAERFEQEAEGRTATLDDGTKLSAEVVLVATGRNPRLQGLDVEKLGITPSRQGVSVDDHCQAEENVWAAGDITGVAQFTHIAYYQGRVVADNILGKTRSADYSAVPHVTFTDPEVASVGIATPGHAPQGMDVVTVHADLSHNARTVTYGEGFKGGLCLLADRRSKTLVGAWAVGPLAGEWIHLAALAIRARVPVGLLEDTILAFPTFTRLYLGPFEELQRKLETAG